MPDISSVYRTGRLQAFKSSRLAPLITAIGISIILQTLAMIIWGASPSFPRPFIYGNDKNWWRYSCPQAILILIVAVTSMTLLLLLVHKTNLGRAMRAVSESPANASLMGISVDEIIRLTFMLGAALAGIAECLSL